MSQSSGKLVVGTYKFHSTFRVEPLQVAGFWCVVTMQINNNTQMENSTDELKCFLKFLSKRDNNCTSVESLQWGDPSCLKESKGNICERLIQMLRVQKTWWARLYFIWSGSVPKSNETMEEAKDTLCVDTYPLWHLNFLGSSAHREMWVSEMSYTHIWILAYAVIAKCYVDAADEKNLLPIHGNICYDRNAFVFQNVISNPPEFFFIFVSIWGLPPTSLYFHYVRK